VLEAFLLLTSPAVLFFVLRLRAMAPVVIPDPSMHTIYMVDPRDFLARFSSVLASIAGTREAARVGFLVPARVSYLLFGAVRGFFVFRYVLCLVAIVPSYMLVRRLYGRAAGAVVVIILMSSPVLVNAWGTDYPDSAVVSYLTGGLACLAMPCRDNRRPAWLAIAATLFTAAVWSHISPAPIVAALMGVYLVVGLVRFRRRLLKDAIVLAVTAAVVTGALMVASGVLFGLFDYIVPTGKAIDYLNSPLNVHIYHSTNARWILVRPYLLVPVAVMAAFVAVFARRLRDIPTPQLLIGLAGVAEVATFVFLQFFLHAEVLEYYFFSSSLWGVACLTLAITLSALAQPLFKRLSTAWLPAALVLAVPLVYEMKPQVSPFGWEWKGMGIVAIVIAVAAIARLLTERAAPTIARAAAAGAAVIITSCLLILTVAPYESHVHLPGVVGDPLPRFSSALGGPVGNLIDQYRVSTELPHFVGNSTYPGEQLLMWYPPGQRGLLLEVTGMYHDSFNEMPGGPTVLTGRDMADLYQRRPAEILVLNTPDISATLQALSPYRPTLLRTTVLKSGDFAVHLWLIALGVYGHGSAQTGP